MEKCRNSFINVDIIGFLSPFSFSYFLFGTWICECALTINHRSKLISIFVAFMNVRQLHLLGVGWGKVGKVGRAGRGWVTVGFSGVGRKLLPEICEIDFPTCAFGALNIYFSFSLPLLFQMANPSSCPTIWRACQEPTVFHHSVIVGIQMRSVLVVS